MLPYIFVIIFVFFFSTQINKNINKANMLIVNLINDINMQKGDF